MHPFFFAIFCTLSSCIAAEFLDCSPTDLPISVESDKEVDIKEPFVNFEYNRNDLQVYQYPGTPSVNLFFNETETSMKAGINIDHVNFDTNRKNFFNSEVIGVANIVNISDYSKGFKDCAFFLGEKTTDSFYKDLPVSLDAKVFQLIEKCISDELCQALGSVQKRDFARARVNPRDFGPLSIWSRSLHIDFPKMIPPKATMGIGRTEKPKNLVDVADSIISNISEIFRKGNNGMIAIPNIKHRLFSASKGTFQGLSSLQRDPSVQLRASPLHEHPQMFSFAISIPEGHVKYLNFKAFRVLPFVGNLCIDVRDIEFMAVVQMNFSRNQCQPILKDFHTLKTGTSRTYTCGRLNFITNPFVKLFVNAWDHEIIDSIERQIDFMMAVYIYENFNCESFRPKRET